jgi:hypothetical protein
MKLPEGWIKTGSNPEQYDMGVDEDVHHNNSDKCGCVKFTGETEPEGGGTLMQTFSAEKYLDKRVRLTGFVKSESADWAGMWMRVDGPEPGKPLAFDNMFNRQIKGTNDWKRYDVVLDVPGKATEIAFGVLLNGKGTVWFDDFKFEEVGNDVAITVKKSRKATVNLNFAK